MQDVRTLEWAFQTTKANYELTGESSADLVPSGKRMAVTYVELITAGGTTVDVNVRIGFRSGGTLPAIVADSASGIEGVFTSHPGIRPGGGKVSSNGGETIALGGDGLSPLLSCSEPTSGELRLILSFTLVEA